MEDKLATALNLPSGSYVLDAGCGVGHVAIHMATHHGFKIQGIDVVERHLKKAERNIARAGLQQGQLEVRKMDYHHLENLPDNGFDGVYTMETFVHATEPEVVLENFYRVLRPGGRIALFE